MEELELHDTVTLADGTVVPCDYLATIPQGYCFISLATADFSVLSAFTDPEKTETILYGEHELHNYSVFVSLSQEEPGRYKIALRKRFVDEEA